MLGFAYQHPAATFLIVLVACALIAPVVFGVILLLEDGNPTPREFAAFSVGIAVVLAGVITVGLYTGGSNSDLAETKYGVTVDGTLGRGEKNASVVKVNDKTETCYRDDDRILCLDDGTFTELEHR